MGTRTEDREEISAEFALRDAMDNVLRHLSVKDLCRAAQVCNSWNQAVISEFSKRGPERILLPDVYDQRIADPKSTFRVSDIMSSKPDVTLLFCGPRPHVRTMLDTEYKILDQYKSQLPNRLIVAGVDVAMMDELEIRSCPSDILHKYKANGILGLFLTNYRQMRTKVTFCESHEHKVGEKAERLVDELMPENRDDKSILILFGRSYYSTAKQVLELIRKRFKAGSYTLWGSTTHNFLKTINCQTDDYPQYKGMEGFIGIRISGPNLNSWAAMFDCRKQSSLEHKLADFRASLGKLKHHRVGLICGPRRPGPDSKTSPLDIDPRWFMKQVKTIFPDVPFIGYFNDGDLYYFGLNSSSDDPNQELMHTMCMSIMILTYD